MFFTTPISHGNGVNIFRGAVLWDIIKQYFLGFSSVFRIITGADNDCWGYPESLMLLEKNFHKIR